VPDAQGGGDVSEALAEERGLQLRVKGYGWMGGWVGGWVGGGGLEVCLGVGKCVFAADREEHLPRGRA